MNLWANSIPVKENVLHPLKDDFLFSIFNLQFFNKNLYA